MYYCMVVAFYFSFKAFFVLGVVICDSVLSCGKCLRQRNVIATWYVGDMSFDRGISNYHIREKENR